MAPRIALLLALLLAQSAAQQAPPAAPTQDPKAWEVLDRADARLYSAKAAGLKDVQYRHTLSQVPGLTLEVKWLAPDKSVAKVAVAADAEPHVRQLAEMGKESLSRTALLTLDMVVGKTNRDTYGGDDLSLAAPNQVRVLARSPRSLRLFKENIFTFDQRGLPITMKMVTADGSVEMEIGYEARGEKFLVKEVSSKSEKGPSRMTFEYQEVQNIVLPASIVQVQGPTTTTQAFTDFKVNQGLKEADLK